MGSPELADFARNFAVMVRVRGPDPKGLKMRRHAFHQYNSGKTTLSASGMILADALFNSEAAKQLLGGDCQGVGLVVTVASVIEPFLVLQHREGVSQGQPKLIPGAQVDVMLEGKLGLERGDMVDFDKDAPRWLNAHLVKLVDVPVSSLAIQSLIEASSGLIDIGWEVGWSLASHDDGPQPFTDAIGTQNRGHLAKVDHASPSLVGKSTTRIAILGVSPPLKDLPKVAVSSLYRRGDFILAVGSPFGVLSPMHFFNSLSKGSISNCYLSRSSNISLLMADIRCLPGMEGGPVFCEQENFIGILIRPLRQRSSGAEIQLVIPWEAIATACSDLLQKEPQTAEDGTQINKENLNAVGISHSLESNCPFYRNSNHLSSKQCSSLLVEKAMASICLITIDEGVWASGILLNDRGLILTNAHLLEPWRFGKTTVNGRRNKGSEMLAYLSEGSVFSKDSEVDGYQKSWWSQKMDSSAVDDSQGYKLGFSYKGHRNIRVRLDHFDPLIWCDAKVVYICKGPLDVALVQLESVPGKLHPIDVDFTSLSPGLLVHVVGHGLFGPRCGFSPSVCSGVVSKVVKATAQPHSQSILAGDSKVPVMLETTAAVHPGGSGGAVINSEGRMIGLVTSNARHGGRTLIPHLNFSIPCAALVPIFEFSKDMQNISLLESLDQPNEQLSSIWALMPPLSPKQSPPLPNLPQSETEDSNKQEKDSRFAKFLAERDRVLRSTQLGKMTERIGRDRETAGFLAGVATVITGHPFDSVKVKLQKHNTGADGIKYRNGLHCTARILQTEGVKGLYRGATSAFIGMAFEGSLMFGIYSQTKQFWQGGVQSHAPQLQVIIPAAAYVGTIISFILCPTEPVKCKMQVQGTDSLVPECSRYCSPLDCALQTVKSEGVRKSSAWQYNLWWVSGQMMNFSGYRNFHGGLATLLRESVGSAVFFGVYEHVRYYMHQPLNASLLEQSHLIDMGIGIMSGHRLAGVACWCFVLPFDAAKTIIQTTPDNSSTRNPFFVLNSIYRRAGLKGSYTGLAPTLARAFPANAASIVTWELAMKLLGIRHG